MLGRFTVLLAVELKGFKIYKAILTHFDPLLYF